MKQYTSIFKMLIRPLSYNFKAKLFPLIAPYDVVGKNKVRIGGKQDGGYVMFDPDKDDVAYSFGVCFDSPWDLEMANKDIKVYQYDGSIDESPDMHPNISFEKVFVSGLAVPPAGFKNLEQILKENGHENNNNLILQIDIEGYEWEFFRNITSEQMQKFKQIVVEFHRVRPGNKNKDFLDILRKIKKTHTPVHVHCNNVSNELLYPNMDFISPLLEVSYVRNVNPVTNKPEHRFTPNSESFPTRLDFPNNPNQPEVKIGPFSRFFK